MQGVAKGRTVSRENFVLETINVTCRSVSSSSIDLKSSNQMTMSITERQLEIFMNQLEVGDT